MKQLLQKARQLYLGLLNRPLPSYERDLLYTLTLSPAKMIGIYGARGVGKTTLMLQWLKKQAVPASESLYISCDHALFKQSNLFELAEYFSQQGIKLLILDEVHEAIDFEQSLKSIYDFLDIKILFSGSSAIALTNPDLTRRFSMFSLSQLSLKESIELSHGLSLPDFKLHEILNQPIDCVFSIQQALGERKILPLYQSYLQSGGYPFYFEDPDNFARRLNDTVNLIIQVELSHLFGINADKIDLLKKLLIVICRSKPLELSIEKITSSVELSKPTLYKFLDYLQRAELLRQVPHELKKYKTIRRADKLYLFHPNLLHSLCLSGDLGTLRETFFASQLGRHHQVEFCDQGDFIIDEQWVFEVGGKSKDFSQLKQQTKPAYLALDDIEIGDNTKIPLWLFGFLKA